MGTAALHRHGWPPLVRAKGDGSLYSSTSSPCPQALAPWGQQWGSPWWDKAGKTEYGLEANPCCSWPQWCHCHPGGDPVQGMWGCTHQPNSPNSPSRYRTRPAASVRTANYICTRCSVGGSLPGPQGA